MPAFPFIKWHLLFLERGWESQKRSSECARVCWRIDRTIKELFCFKCTFLTPCINRVGCEFWHYSRNHEGRVSAVKCCQIVYLSSGTSAFVLLLFFWASTSITPPPHTHSLTYVCHFFLSSFHRDFSRVLPSFSLCYYGVPRSLYECVGVWQHSAHHGLDLRSHRNCGGPLRGWGWQGGKECGKRDKERDNHTNTCGWQNDLEEVPCDLIPLLWLRLLVHVHWGGNWLRFFFSVTRKPIKRGGVKNWLFVFLLFSWRGREASQPLPRWLRAYFLLVENVRSLALLFYSFLFPRGERAKGAKNKDNVCFPQY